MLETDQMQQIAREINAPVTGFIAAQNGNEVSARFSMETDDAKNTLHLRGFCPALGADEVPASGTTNGAMPGYLMRCGFIKPQSQQILVEQGSEIGRASVIYNEIKVEQGQISDLWVGGQAVASIRGALTV